MLSEVYISVSPNKYFRLEYRGKGRIDSSGKLGGPEDEAFAEQMFLIGKQMRKWRYYLKKQANKITLLTCSILFLICGWQISYWYYNNFDYWLARPDQVLYLGLNNEKQSFDFEFPYTGYSTHIPYSQWGVTPEQVVAMDIFFSKNKYRLTGYLTVDGSARLYLLSKPRLELHTIIPTLFCDINDGNE